MIDAINTNGGVDRVVGKPVTAPAGQTAPRKEEAAAAKATAHDTAEVSSVSQDLETYMTRLRQAPDVRKDVVEDAKAAVAQTVHWPPLDIIHGISRLVGGVRNDLS